MIKPKKTVSKIKERLLRDSLIITLMLVRAVAGHAQEVLIELGPDEIGVNEIFTIRLTLKNASLKSYSDFPEIKGLAKRNTSSSSSSSYINGQVSSEQSIIQRYTPLKEGIIVIPPFSMEVNGKTVSSQGKMVKIGPAVERRQNSRSRFTDPFDQFFGGRDERPTEFIDIKEDAFLALTTDKEEVYVGEGFTTTFAFYVADANQAPLQFYEAGKQLSEILKNIRPESCWEENFNIENIYGKKVNINGKRYTRYKIYQATYYPLNLETIHFPSVPFEMIKYKVAKSPSFFGRDRQEDFKTFYTSEKSVKVKALPPHPLKEGVAVGVFELDESIDKTSVETGSSFAYHFNIYGEGNIAGINAPQIATDKKIDFYPPNFTQDINRGNGRVTGTKKFSYFGIPNEPGHYEMGDYFNWVFFNPETARYDTLKSQVAFEVTGESKQNNHISSNDLGSFYNGIDGASNKPVTLKKDKTRAVLANILLLAMLGAASFIFFKK